MNKEIKNCRREWDKVDANKRHCRYLCNNGNCDNVYCTWNLNKGVKKL